MRYIIDANNLAGQLKILDEDNFDDILVELLKKYKFGKQHKFYLVFDSNDPMGDRAEIDNRIIVVRTPRDNYYKDADDKILEIAEDIDSKEKIVVTNDIEIKEKVKELNDEKKLNIELLSVTEFAEDLERAKEIDKEQELSEDDMENINDELLNIWK